MWVPLFFKFNLHIRQKSEASTSRLGFLPLPLRTTFFLGVFSFMKKNTRSIYLSAAKENAVPPSFPAFSPASPRHLLASLDFLAAAFLARVTILGDCSQSTWQDDGVPKQHISIGCLRLHWYSKQKSNVASNMDDKFESKIGWSLVPGASAGDSHHITND